MKISVIITVYNLEKYIEQCVRSVISQTYKNLEIILVDDGSTDSSGTICKKLEISDARIKYFYKKNGGASSSRNFGIKESMGDYIMFIDGDDYLFSDFVIEELVRSIKRNNCDILFYRMASFYEKTKRVKYDNEIQGINENEVYSNEIINKLVCDSKLSISPCDKIIRSTILKDCKIYFDELLKIYEDIDWSFKIYLVDKIKYSFTNNVVYVYRKQRNGSATYNIDSKKLESMYSVICYWYLYNYRKQFIKEAFLNYLSYQYTILLSLMNRKNCDRELKEKIFSISSILDYADNYKVKKVNKVRRIIGMKNTIICLKIYSFLKKLGVYRIGENG